MTQDRLTKTSIPLGQSSGKQKKNIGLNPKPAAS